MSLKNDFKNNVTHAEHGGVHYYDCDRGLFSTSSRKKEVAEQQALERFECYWSDGEYGIN